MVGMVLQRPGQAMPSWPQPHVEPGIERPGNAAPARHRRLGVADQLQLLGDPADREALLG
jgi:hypothetical protein